MNWGGRLGRESEPRRWPHVAIVIVNWNGWQDTLECLASLRRLTYPNVRVLVVDNASTNDSVARIREACPDVEIIEIDRNLGWAGGSNVGIRMAMAGGAAYIWLLNNDTVVDPQALAAMVERAEQDPRVGVVGSKICYDACPQVLWSAGGEIRWWQGGATRHRGQDHISGPEYEVARPVHYVTGCSLLTSFDVIRRVGLLPEEYYLYYEETEWCLRVWRAGLKVVYEPQSVVYHKVSRSSTASPALLEYYLTRNRLLFVRRMCPWWLPLTLADTVRWAIARRLWIRDPDAWRMNLQGIMDFLRGRQGPYRGDRHI
jgi:GT2 family glycosyltransferase